MDKISILEHSSLSVDYTLFGGRWVPHSSRLAVFGQHAKGTGALQVLNLSGGKLTTVAQVGEGGKGESAVEWERNG